MTKRPYLLSETTWKTIKHTNYELAILPWGSTEAHNYHLPFAADTIQADYIAIESARKAWESGAKVIVLPTVPFGVNTGQLDIKLVINMNPSTQAAVLRDVVDSIYRHDIRKLVVLNGHGANDFRQIIREVQPSYSRMFICTLDWWRAVNANEFFNEPGDHAGEMETSTMLHISPDLVLDLSQAGSGTARRFKFRALKEGWAWAQREWSAVTSDTGVGDPAGATAKKGEEFLEAASKNIADFLVELTRCDLNDLYE